MNNDAAKFKMEALQRTLKGKMKGIVEALNSDATDATALSIGSNLAGCLPSNKCGLVFCPDCRGRKANRLYQKAIKNFGLVDKTDLRFVTIIHSIQYDIGDVSKAIDLHRGQLRRCFQKNADKLRVMGFFEVDLKTPNMYRGQYKTAHAADVGHRPHAKALFKGLGLDLETNKLPDKFYLVHLHAIVDVSSLNGAKLNSSGILKKAFPEPYQCRVSPLWDTQSKSEALKTICSYMVKFRLQFSDNIYANDPSKTTKSVYTDAYPDDEIIKFCKFAAAHNNFDGFKYDRGL